jgi:retinol dehydrogenase 14
MQGRVVLITGSTSGIGKVTALELAQQGATVLAVSRDRARGEATVAELRSRAGGGAAELFVADLSSQEEVRRLAREVRARHERLHVLVNNAGAIFRTRRATADGLEGTFALNHLAPFLLTHLLRDLLQASAPARVVTVASAAHRFARIDFDDLQGERRYRWARAYAQSKLANVLFTYELARRLEGTGVTANCLHPGGVATGLWRESRGFVRALLWLGRPFMLGPERGAETMIYLAAAPEVEGVSGRYFVRKEEQRSSAASYDRDTAARLWDVSAALAPDPRARF